MKISYEQFLQYYDINTGDLLLYKTTYWYSRLIEYFSHSPYSHVGLICKRSDVFDTCIAENGETMDDYFVFESGYEQYLGTAGGGGVCGSGQVLYDTQNKSPCSKWGVQLFPLRDVYRQYIVGDSGDLYIRKLRMYRNGSDGDDDMLRTRYELLRLNLRNVYRHCINKPYDTTMYDWVVSYYEQDADESTLEQFRNCQRTDCFWCSAFVGYLFVICRLAKRDTPWSLLTPNDFSTYQNPKRIQWVDCDYDREVQVSKNVVEYAFV